MVKGRIFLIVTTVSAWATPSAILEPREGTPCLHSCEKSPSSDSCKLCCGQVKHEVDWKCGAASSDDKAACCENWKEQCWNVASDQNLGHACNQCTFGIGFSLRADRGEHEDLERVPLHDIIKQTIINVQNQAAPSDGDGSESDDDKDSDTSSDDASDSARQTGLSRDTIPVHDSSNPVLEAGQIW